MELHHRLGVRIMLSAILQQMETQYRLHQPGFHANYMHIYKQFLLQPAKWATVMVCPISEHYFCYPRGACSHRHCAVNAAIAVINTENLLTVLKCIFILDFFAHA